mgnify:CR=1 FL=1
MLRCSLLEADVDLQRGKSVEKMTAVRTIWLSANGAKPEAQMKIYIFVVARTNRTLSESAVFLAFLHDGVRCKVD